MCAGWNDPPPVSYRSMVQPASKKGFALTKRPQYPADRVATSAPTSSDSPGQSKHSNSLPPPVDSLSSSPLKPSPDPQCTNVSEREQQQPKESPPVDQTQDSLLTVEEIVTCLNQLLDEHKEHLQKRALDDMRKRVLVMSQQCEEGKISPAVHQKMSALVRALTAKDYSSADTMHVALMIDHVSEVSQWMVAIKKLVTVAKQYNS